MIKELFIDKTLTYDGTQLRSHWIFDTTGEVGPAIAAFIGPADVPIAHMVDCEDVRANAPIASHAMVHVIVEHFDGDLLLAIARQRLLVAIAADLLRDRLPDIRREGNDLKSGDRKLSVSIATACSVSMLIHFGVNIISDGTPVPTLGLADVGVEPKTFACELMSAYSAELAGMNKARCKVRGVE